MTNARRDDARLGCLLLAASMLLTNPLLATGAAEDQVISLGRVVVTGSFSMYQTKDSSAYVGLNAFPTFSVGSYLTWEAYADYKLEMAELLKSPTGIPDVRCNLLATTTTRDVTSRSSFQDRWQAAQQLHSAIKASHPDSRGVGANVRSSLSIFFGGGKKPSFTVTYADGGKEVWLIVPNSTVALDMSGTNQMTSQADGEKKPCPVPGLG